MGSTAADVVRKIAVHTWMAALGIAALACLQASWSAERVSGEVVAERVVVHTASGVIAGAELADADVTNTFPDLMSTIGNGDHQVPLSAILSVVVLLGLAISVVPGVVVGLVEALVSPKAGWRNALVRAALVAAWLVPLAMMTTEPAHRAGAAGAALTGSLLLAAMTWPRHLAATTVRWALLVGLVWWAAPVAERIAEAQPFAPTLGDVGGISRLIAHEDAPESHHPSDDWLEPAESAMQAPKHVVVIAVDTMAATHASTHGYERPTLPTVQQMADDEGVVFEHNYSSAPWTLPSTTSLFTSLHPHQHGLEDDGRRLREDVVTLAGAFSSQGWHTAALVTHLYVSAKFGLDSGFHEFWELSIDFNFGAGHQLIAEQLDDRVVPWLREHHDEKFFLYVHYFDPHWDYEPPAPYDTMFTDPGYSGHADGTWPFMAPFVRTTREMNEADLAHCIALYDGEIAYTDDNIGAVFDEMRRLGIWDESLVVVIADHGEEFQEHDSFGHARTVYDELVWVPLILKPAGGRPEGWRTRVPEQTRSIDLAPTLLEAAGLQIPPDFAGTSLVPVMESEGEDRDAFARTVRQRRHKVTVVHNRWKLIRDRHGDEEELYDLEADPLEQRNVLEDHPEIAADLRRRLDAVLEDPGGSGAGQRFVEDVELSDAEREALEALGYVQ